MAQKSFQPKAAMTLVNNGAAAVGIYLKDWLYPFAGFSRHSGLSPLGRSNR